VRARQTPDSRWLALWALFSSCALLVHNFAVFLVLAEALWLVVPRRRSRGVWFAAGSVALTGLAIAPVVLIQQQESGLDWVPTIPLSQRLGEVPGQFAAGLDSPHHALAMATALALIVSTVVWALWRGDAGYRYGAMLAGSVGLAVIAAPLVLSGAGMDYLVTRNVIVAWLPLAAVMAGGLASVRPRLAGLLVLGALCALSWSSPPGSRPTRRISVRPGDSSRTGSAGRTAPASWSWAAATARSRCFSISPVPSWCPPAPFASASSTSWGCGPELGGRHLPRGRMLVGIRLQPAQRPTADGAAVACLRAARNGADRAVHRGALSRPASPGAEGRTPAQPRLPPLLQTSRRRPVLAASAPGPARTARRHRRRATTKSDPPAGKETPRLISAISSRSVPEQTASSGRGSRISAEGSKVDRSRWRRRAAAIPGNSRLTNEVTRRARKPARSSFATSPDRVYRRRCRFHSSAALQSQGC